MEAPEIMLKDPGCFTNVFSSLNTDGTRHHVSKEVFFDHDELLTELMNIKLICK